MESDRSLFRMRFLSERRDDFRDARERFDSISDCIVSLSRKEIKPIRISTLPVPELIEETTPDALESPSSHTCSLSYHLYSATPQYDTILEYMRNRQYDEFKNIIRVRRFSDDLNQYDVDIEPLDEVRLLELRFPLRFPKSITPEAFMRSRTPAEQLAFEGELEVVAHMRSTYNANILPIMRGLARGGHVEVAENMVDRWNDFFHRSTEPEVPDLRTAMATGFAQAGNIPMLDSMIQLGAHRAQGIHDLALNRHIDSAYKMIAAHPGDESLKPQFLRGLVVSEPGVAREYIQEQRSRGEIIEDAVSSMVARLLSHRQYELINTWLEENVITLQEVANAIDHLASFELLLSEGYHEDRLRTFLAFHQTPHAVLCDKLELHPIEHARAMTIHSWMQLNKSQPQSHMNFEQAFYISNSHRLTMLVNEMTRDNRIGFRDAYLMVSRPEIYQLLVRTRSENYTNEERVMLRHLFSQAIPNEITQHILSFLLPSGVESISGATLNKVLPRQNRRIFSEIDDVAANAVKRKIATKTAFACSAEARVSKRARKK